MFSLSQRKELGRVVLIEDDDDVRWSLALLLRARGFSVDVFRSGLEVLNNHRWPAADCMLIDYKMPDMNGLALLRKLRASGLKTPAFLITGFFANNLHEHAKEAGFNDVVEKPALESNLIPKISAFVA